MTIPVTSDLRDRHSDPTGADADRLSVKTGSFAGSTPSLFISAAEQSGDEHAAALIQAFGRLVPGATFAGLAGPAMRQAGCACFHDMTARSAMALGALGRVPEAVSVFARLRGLFAVERFDAAVLVDSPTLNMKIAWLCRRAGVPVYYYIAPQTWAWAPWRNKSIARRVDRLGCIWPFEESYFRERGIAADYVGHPSFDRLLAQHVDEARIRALRDGASPVVGLLPGSRRHVVAEVLPGQLQAAVALAVHFRHIRFLLVAANADARGLIESELASLGRKLNLVVLDADPDKTAAIRASDLVLAASGTVTLEVAFHHVPMIVMYNANPWAHRLIARWLITTPYLSIPNILAGREIVPEFMPCYRTVDPIIARAVELLGTPASLDRVRADLRAVIDPIIKPGAAANAAQHLAELIGIRVASATAART